MIAINELRQGSRVLYAGVERRILEILAGDRVTLAGMTGLVGSEELRGIVLTPAQLERCSFSTSAYKNRVMKRGAITFYVVNDRIEECRVGKLTVECKYLHQLQNIMLVLIGIEMNMN